MPSTIDLDHNATTQPLPEVIEVMVRHYRDTFANPGSRHRLGRRARLVLEQARESMASILGADPDEVIFTSGGTESINIALHGLIGEQVGAIALTAGEHPAVRETCRHLQRRGARLINLSVDGHGRLRPAAIDDLPWGELRLVTVILAHNEHGVIQDVAPLAAACAAHRVPLHLDAVQAVGKIPVDFHGLGATALSLGAHKFHGPRGIGALLVRDETTLAPFLWGGHQESGRRPGTEAVPLIAGMARALELFHAEQESRTARLTRLRDTLVTGLAARCAPVVINGAGAPRLPNTLNIAFPGLDAEALLVALDMEEICCSLGSTCASGAAEPAPALVAMGCPPEVIRGSIRFSVGIDNTEAEMEEAVERISRVIARMPARRTGSSG